MIQQDTVKLLRECDAGVKMGISSIEQVLGRVKQEAMKKVLQDCRKEHLALQEKLQSRLEQFSDHGKAPNPLAQGMSHMKTAVKLGIHETDEAIASLMTDGCHMGIKSLNRYLNQYGAAEEYAKDMTKKLIQQEQQLSNRLQKYL